MGKLIYLESERSRKGIAEMTPCEKGPEISGKSLKGRRRPEGPGLVGERARCHQLRKRQINAELGTAYRGSLSRPGGPPIQLQPWTC